MPNTATKRITLATIKSFIKKNDGKIWINVKSSFDGMTDGVEQLHGGFNPAKDSGDYYEHTLGIKGAWLVGQSRDYFSQYDDGVFTGYDASNSCGHFIIAVKNN